MLSCEKMGSTGIGNGIVILYVCMFDSENVVVVLL